MSKMIFKVVRLIMLSFFLIGFSSTSYALKFEETRLIFLKLMSITSILSQNDGLIPKLYKTEEKNKIFQIVLPASYTIIYTRNSMLTLKQGGKILMKEIFSESKDSDFLSDDYLEAILERLKQIIKLSESQKANLNSKKVGMVTVKKVIIT
jgi:hypothetical protein